MKEKVAWAIRSWWNERIIGGCQLQFLEDTVSGIDWKGEERWKKVVAVETLHRDFERSRGVSVSKNLFGWAFKKGTNQIKFGQQQIFVQIGAGLIMKKHRNFVLFGERPQLLLPE